MEMFGREHFVEGRSYYTHFASWLPRRHDPNVLLLAYEHMKDDHQGTVRRIAESIVVGTESRRLAIAWQESSLESMKLHHKKYDDCLMRERSELVCGLPPGSVSSKVRAGEVGAHRAELSETYVNELDATWRETMTADFGVAGYDELLELLKAEG